MGSLAESGGRRVPILAVAVGAIGLDTALLGLIAPLLPEIEDRTGASELALGLSLAAYSIPIIGTSLPLGRLADRIGRRPLLLAGLLMTAVGSLLIAGSESLALLVAGRAIQGFGSAASWIAALALVGDLAPAGRKGEMIGYALAANSVGAIGGPAIGGTTADAFGFAAPFLIVAAAALLLAGAGWLLLPRDYVPSGSSLGGWRGIRAVAFSAPVLPATAISIAGATTIGLLEVVVPLDLDQRLGYSATVIGLLFAAGTALDATAAPIAGRTGDRIGRRPVATVGLAVLALAALPLALVGGVWGPAIGLGLFGLGSSIAFAAAVPWLDDAFGEFNRGAAFGGLNLLYALGYAGGPLLAGGLLELSGPDLAYGVLGVVIAAGAAAVYFHRPPLPPTSTPPDL